MHRAAASLFEVLVLTLAVAGMGLVIYLGLAMHG